MPTYPSSFASASSPPHHNRLHNHSPTKSSPLRHALSTRSNASEHEDAISLSRNSTLSSHTGSNYSHTASIYSQSSVESSDPFAITSRTPSKRDRSESPVKKSAAFAKWEQRERAERDIITSPSAGQQREKTIPGSKKICDRDWRDDPPHSPSRFALQPVTPNKQTEKKSLPSPKAISTVAVENIETSDASLGIENNGEHRFQDRTMRLTPQDRISDKSSATVRASTVNPVRAVSQLGLATPSRSDSIRANSQSRDRGHVRFKTTETSLPQLDDKDIASLQRSSTPQLRHLSKLAVEVGAEDLTIHSPEEQVAGLAGRRRLQRSDSVRATAKPQSNFASQYTGTRWMDTQRRHIQAYEYLCHIGEAREWLQDVLEPTELPPIVQLEEFLRDGVTLAETVLRLAPALSAQQQAALGSLRIFKSEKLQYRHSDNIALFFRFLAGVELPELFRFELIDLYEKKNIPKVIYCIHALSWLLYRKGLVDFRIGNLLGQLQFEEHELEETQKGIDRSGVQMPNFGGMREAMQIEPDPLPPEPTPEELLENQHEMIIDLQSQIRGAFLRINLGDTMQQLWDVEESVVGLQALIRGGFARQIYAFRSQMDQSTRAFQAFAKGYLVRSQQRNQQQSWEENDMMIVKLQSLWRGRQQRQRTHRIKILLRSQVHGLKELQSAIRGALGRWRASDIWYETQDTASDVEQLQAAIRGVLLRSRVGQIVDQVDSAEDTIIRLQAVIRGRRSRERYQTTQAVLRVARPRTTEFQSLARGLLQRRSMHRVHCQLIHQSSHLKGLQSRMRGFLTRTAQYDQSDTLQKHAFDTDRLIAHAKAYLVRKRRQQTQHQIQSKIASVTELQACSRAFLQRRSLGLSLATLEDEEPTIQTLQSIIRASRQRQSTYDVLSELAEQEAVHVQLQSCARAMVARSRVGRVLMRLDEDEEVIAEVQAACRGFLVRAQFTAKQKHYRDNMAKVIKLQSFVRAKQQGESYQALVNGKNPPLPVVRRHLHLLTDTRLEFESEMEAERLRKQVGESVRRNELVESYVEGLDVKIALLVKNKITLDEVVKHQKHFGGSASQLLRDGAGLQAQGTSSDLKALNKSSRRKLTSYEELFFILQTQPAYLSSIFRRLSERGLAETDAKVVEKTVMALFGQVQRSREEYLLLKLFAANVQQSAKDASNAEEFLRQQNNSFSQRLLLSYVRSSKDRVYLKSLLGSLIRDGVCGRENLDLESDPLQIYRAILNNEELSTGAATSRPRDISREMAIREHDVRPTYVQHLQELRDLCDAFFISLDDSFHSMPFGVRFVLAEQYRMLIRKFPREDARQLAVLVGNWFWRFYLVPSLKEPELWGVMDRGLSPFNKRNLSQIVTVLSQVVSGRGFGADNLYLQPLNNWIMESLERWHETLFTIFDIPAPEEYFNADEYSDLYARTKPTLLIKLADIFALHRLISDHVAAIVPARDDVLKEILADLGTAKSNENDLSGAVRGGEITLTLKSRYAVHDDPNAEARALFTATKRLVLYVIKVQSGSNLMEILTRPITHEDADRWLEIVQEEHAASNRDRSRHRRPPSRYEHNASLRGGRTPSVYSEAPSAISDDRHDLLDIDNMTYAELKSTALENILLLERSSVPTQFRVSRSSNYQEILNALAGDIRQKHRRRLERQREAEATRITLSQLDSKARFLEDQLRSYNDYIEQCLHTLASKKGSKHKFIMPFTKQWSHERELEKLGRQPKFGSYKYSARQLADKGVLLSWDGYAHESWGQLNVVLSSDEVGVFHVEASAGSTILPGGHANLLLDELLQAQYDNKSAITIFDEAEGGGARLAVNLLLHLVFKKFYRDE